VTRGSSSPEDEVWTYSSSNFDHIFEVLNFIKFSVDIAYIEIHGSFTDIYGYLAQKWRYKLLIKHLCFQAISPFFVRPGHIIWYIFIVGTDTSNM